MAQRAFCPITRTASYDSDATADNLPGAGRSLGLLFGFLGRRLESAVGRFMANRGHGPNAIADTVARLRQHSERSLCEIYVECATRTAPPLGETERKKLAKKCKKLIRYSR